MQSRGGECQRVFFHRRVKRDHKLFCGLSHNLLSGPGPLRNKHLKVSVDLARTGEPYAGAVFRLQMLQLVRRWFGRGNMRHAGLEIVLLKITLLDPHLALAADLLVSAKRFEVNAEKLCCLEDCCPFLYFTTPACRLENHLKFTTHVYFLPGNSIVIL